MKRWMLAFVVGVFGAVCLQALPATAQDSDAEGQRVYVKHDEEDWDDHDRYALGIAFGLVEVDQLRVETLTNGGAVQRVSVSSEVEPYIDLSLRIGVAKRRPVRRGRGYGGEEVYHAHAYRGYIEPEIGYWETDDRGTSQSDLLVGVNFVGVSPVGAGADFFAGGGIGIHFIDQDINLLGRTVSESETAIGVNAQFGADIHVSENLTFYGMGRFDLVDTDDIELGTQSVAPDSLQIKAMVGLRFYF